MAFKSLTQYNEERFGDFFLLRNNNDTADVIFLYQSSADVLVADVHYIKSAEYSGYAHCCGQGCPACNYGTNGIRTQSKLFIPLYNLTSGKIEFWDRSLKFEPQLTHDVFANYENPSEYVFRISRHGEANSIDTTYEIQAIGRNSSLPYAKILADHGVKFPDYYEHVCRDLSPMEMSNMLNANSAKPTSEYTYTPTPRPAYTAPSFVEPSMDAIPVPEPVTIPVPTEYSNAAPASVADVPVPEAAAVSPAVPPVAEAATADPVEVPVGAPTTPEVDDTSDDLSDVSF